MIICFFAGIWGDTGDSYDQAKDPAGLACPLMGDSEGTEGGQLGTAKRGGLHSSHGRNKAHDTKRAMDSNRARTERNDRSGQARAAALREVRRNM